VRLDERHAMSPHLQNPWCCFGPFLDPLIFYLWFSGTISETIVFFFIISG
jgi:hypothetical protein